MKAIHRTSWRGFHRAHDVGSVVVIISKSPRQFVIPAGLAHLVANLLPIIIRLTLVTGESLLGESAAPFATLSRIIWRNWEQRLRIQYVLVWHDSTYIHREDAPGDPVDFVGAKWLQFDLRHLHRRELVATFQLRLLVGKSVLKKKALWNLDCFVVGVAHEIDLDWLEGGCFLCQVLGQIV